MGGHSREEDEEEEDDDDDDDKVEEGRDEEDDDETQPRSRGRRMLGRSIFYVKYVKRTPIRENARAPWGLAATARAPWGLAATAAHERWPQPPAPRGD